jgi:charged multivesicular body protein 1
MGQQNSTRQMHNTLFNLKYTAKQLIRSSKNCEKQEKLEKKKLKKAIEKGNMEGAKIYASNAIRQKNQALNYLRLSSRIDAVAARVETAVRMNTLTKDMFKVTKGMDGVLQTMNPERISMVMDKFERQFEDLDVASAYAENSMNASSSMTTPEGQVDDLINMVADEHGLNVADGIAAAPTAAPQGTGVAASESDFAARLAALKN